MAIDSIDQKDYALHKNSVANSIQRIIEDDPETYVDEFRAFNRLVFDLCSDAPPDTFILTDGAYDQGIDFYTSSDRSYEVFQCKFANLDGILESDRPLSFDQKGVNELENAYKYLTEQKVADTANDKVKRLRSQIVTEGYDNIAFNLCLFGYLTEDAKQKFDRLKQTYEKDPDIFKFRLITWEDIVQDIKSKTHPVTSNRYRFRVFDNKLLSSHDYCYFIGYARDFKDVFQKYGWSLFDLNVRSEIKKSRVNKQIVTSIEKGRSRKYFHHLNNGLLLMSQNYKIPEQKDYITVNNFQIINGCQTVVSINRAFDRISNDKLKVSDFNEKCLVQVKVIQRSKETMDMVDQIVVSTNNQNTMSLRNLKSNTEEQRNIKNMFYHLPKRWFYQRKDGEFEALKSGFVDESMFRKSDYRDKGNAVFRVIDNKDLAKTWTCFCGFSYQAMMTSDFFRDEKMYERIFKWYPTDRLWSDFLDPEIEIEPEDSYFEVGQPTAEEYLVSYLIWEFIREYSIGPVKNRTAALERGVKEKKLERNSKGDIISSQEDQAKYLTSDSTYMINNIINNSKEVILEMYSFVLAKKYGSGSQVMKRILTSEPLMALYSSPDFRFFVLNMGRSKDNILFSIYEFLRYALKQLYASIYGEFAAASRRKSYLARPYFVRRFKNTIVELESMDQFKGLLKDWKDVDKSFFDSLPNL